MNDIFFFVLLTFYKTFCLKSFKILKFLLNRDPTPPVGSGEGLSPSEELMHLKRQIVNLNRRVMTIEAQQLQREQKDKFVYAIGIAYLIIKVISWLHRS